MLRKAKKSGNLEVVASEMPRVVFQEQNLPKNFRFSSTCEIRGVLEQRSIAYYQKFHIGYVEPDEDKEIDKRLLRDYEKGLRTDAQKISFPTTFKRGSDVLYIKNTQCPSLSADIANWVDDDITFSPFLHEQMTEMQDFITVKSVNRTAYRGTKGTLISTLTSFGMTDAKKLSLLDIEKDIVSADLIFESREFGTAKYDTKSAKVFIAPLMGVIFLVLCEPSFGNAVGISGIKELEMMKSIEMRQ